MKTNVVLFQHSIIALLRSCVWIVSLGIITLSSGCAMLAQSGPEPNDKSSVAAELPEPCPAITSASLVMAFDQMNKAMAMPHCIDRVERYFDQLLSIAAEAPNLANRERFHHLFKQLDSAGIISKAQATRWYTQYFSTSFMALPDTYNVCSAGRQQDRILADMSDELRLKERGLMQVLGERALYFTARQRHDDIGMILQTTAMACQDHS